MEKYAFYDHHMSEFIKRSLFLFLLTLFFSAIFRTKLIFYFFIIEFLYLVYLQSTRIELIYLGDNRISLHQKGRQEIYIHLPVEVNKWWNYLTPRSLPISSPYGTYKQRIHRQNIVMSYLEITDSKNQKINFTEKIIYGTRFPNESEYSLKTPDSNQISIKIDRTDKLFDFLIDCTYQ